MLNYCLGTLLNFSNCRNCPFLDNNKNFGLIAKANLNFWSIEKVVVTNYNRITL